MTHLHDNLESLDKPLFPSDGKFCSSTAMLTIQKVRYENTVTLEVAGRTNWRNILTQAARPSQSLEHLCQG